MRCLVLALALAIVSCTTTTIVPSASPAAPPPASLAIAAPSVAATSTATVAPSDPYGPIVTTALGVLTGDQVMWLQERGETNNTRILVELMVMPLGGGPAKVAVAYRKSAGGVGLEPQNAIARQLSPDGRRIVLHTPKGIVLFDLENGSQRVLASGVLPVWRLGDTIAYYKPISEATYGGGDIWLVDTNGRDRQFPAQGAPLAWTRDGMLMVGRLEPSGRLTPVLYGLALGQSWTPFTSLKDFISPGGSNVVPLTTKPTVNFIAAMALTDARGDNAHIDVISLIGATTQDVGPRASGSFVGALLEEPRWNPAADQILYRRARAAVRETWIYDLQTRSDVKASMSVSASRAEWTPDGEQIVYLSADQPATVRAVRPISGRDDRELYRTLDPMVRLTDLATFRYVVR